MYVSILSSSLASAAPVSGVDVDEAVSILDAIEEALFAAWNSVSMLLPTVMLSSQIGSKGAKERGTSQRKPCEVPVLKVKDDSVGEPAYAPSHAWSSYSPVRFTRQIEPVPIW